MEYSIVTLTVGYPGKMTLIYSDRDHVEKVLFKSDSGGINVNIKQ